MSSDWMAWHATLIRKVFLKIKIHSGLANAKPEGDQFILQTDFFLFWQHSLLDVTHQDRQCLVVDDFSSRDEDLDGLAQHFLPLSLHLSAGQKGKKTNRFEKSFLMAVHR